MRFHELYEQYHEKVQFLNIYIREAHPKDGWWLGLRLTKKTVKRYAPKVSMDYYDPQTIEERRAVAGDCETALQYGSRHMSMKWMTMSIMPVQPGRPGYIW